MQPAIESFPIHESFFDPSLSTCETVERLLLQLPEELVRIISLLRLVRYHLQRMGMDKSNIIMLEMQSLLARCGLPDALLDHAMTILQWVLPDVFLVNSSMIEQLEIQIVKSYFG